MGSWRSGRGDGVCVRTGRLVTGDEIVFERAERAFCDVLLRLAHECEVKVQVMQGQEPQAEDFTRFYEMAYVAAGKACASRSRSPFWINLAFVEGKWFVAQADESAGGESAAIARDAGG